MKLSFSSRILISLAIGGLLLAPNLGLAGEVVSGGTVTYIQTSASTNTLADGTSIQHFTSSAVVLCNNPEDSLHLAPQDVSGVNIIDAEGNVTLSTGSGSIVDRDGDVMVFGWKATSNDNSKWKISGGTGKYANVKGGGTSKTVLYTSDGRQVVVWDGKWSQK